MHNVLLDGASTEVIVRHMISRYANESGLCNELQQRGRTNDLESTPGNQRARIMIKSCGYEVVLPSAVYLVRQMNGQ